MGMATRLLFISFVTGCFIISSPSMLGQLTETIAYPQTTSLLDSILEFIAELFGGHVVQEIPQDTPVAIVNQVSQEMTKNTPVPTTNQVSQDPPVAIVTQTPQDYKSAPRITVYPYVFNSNHKSISFTTYGGLDNHLAKETHTYTSNPDEIVTKLLRDSDQDNYLKPLISEIKKQSSNKDEQAKIAISLVQNIPYNQQRAGQTQTIDWLYPYETLYLNNGVCSDKSILLSYILNELGYDVVYFEFDQEDHATVGIKTDPKYTYKNTGYAFIETNTPSIITYSNGDYGINGNTKLTTTPRIIHLTGGKGILDVSHEYKDTMTYTELIGINVLPPLQYRQLEILIWEYGLLNEMNKHLVTEDPTNKPICDNGGQLCNGKCYTCISGRWTCTRSGAACV